MLRKHDLVCEGVGEVSLDGCVSWAQEMSLADAATEGTGAACPRGTPSVHRASGPYQGPSANAPPFLALDIPSSDLFLGPVLH